MNNAKNLSNKSEFPEQLRSISELSAWLNVPIKTIYKWTSDHNSGLPYYKIGKRLRFRFSDVESWLQKYKGSQGAQEFARHE
jgi:excisionase family DNA binding protein